MTEKIYGLDGSFSAYASPDEIKKETYVDEQGRNVTSISASQIHFRGMTFLDYLGMSLMVLSYVILILTGLSIPISLSALLANNWEPGLLSTPIGFIPLFAPLVLGGTCIALFFIWMSICYYLDDLYW